MTPTIGYTNEAADDLAQIWERHAAKVGIRAADQFERRIEATLLEAILPHPSAGRARPELGSDIRSFPIAPYVMFYRIGKAGVQVLRLIHGHRDIRTPLMALLVAV